MLSDPSDKNADAGLGDITIALQSVAAGEREAIEKLVPLVYQELRSLAKSKLRNERPDHTLQPTALVHEVIIRILGREAIWEWENRRHFFSSAATAMRQILVDSARAKTRAKRKGTVQLGDVGENLVDDAPIDLDSFLDLDSSLAELEKEDAEAAELVKLRLFVGLSVSEAADVMEISRSKAYEEWQFARFWFANRDM